MWLIVALLTEQAAGTGRLQRLLRIILRWKHLPLQAHLVLDNSAPDADLHPVVHSGAVGTLFLVCLAAWWFIERPLEAACRRDEARRRALITELDAIDDELEDIIKPRRSHLRPRY